MSINLETLRHTLLDASTISGAVFIGLLFLLGAMALAALIRKGAKEVEPRLPDRTGLRFIGALGQALAYLLAFILYANLVPELRSLGTTLLAGVSIVSIVIGLAAQNTLGNLVAGFVLVLYRPVRVGDHVQLTTPRGLATALVTDISLGYTVLIDDESADEIIVPNSVMANATMIRMKEKSGA